MERTFSCHIAVVPRKQMTLEEERGMPALVVLVNADRRIRRETEEILSQAGYRVEPLGSYTEAKNLLDSITPDLLLVDIRLGEFNGLQLAIGSRFDHPSLPVIVTHVEHDPIFEAEASHQGVRFLAVPPGDPEFLRQIQSALEEHRREQATLRRWSRKQVAGRLEVSAADAQARIIDMSYGGVRLAFRDQAEIPVRFEIRLPSSDIPIKAHRVWTALGSHDQFWCGAELDEGTAPQWREFVNSAAV
jgi:PleD family two-component response regulator